MKCPNCKGTGNIKYYDHVVGWRWEFGIWWVGGFMPVPVMRIVEKTLYKVASVVTCANCSGRGKV